MTMQTLELNPTQSATDEAEILAVLENLVQANHEKNVAQFAAQFSPDAAVFNLAPPLRHDGIDLKEKQEWFDSWSTPIDLEARDFKVEVSGDLAVCHGFLKLTGTKKGKEGAVSFWMRETLTLKRMNGAWKIVHEHTSVPFYMDGSLRPAFDLRP
jgi:ketosteroid isomerase-like protein